MIALLAPGQGAQSPGMLSAWLELDGAERRLTAWSERTGLDLIRLGTTADAEEIKDTAVTQPLIVALTLLAHEELTRRVEIPAGAPAAGHSVGELAAAAMAGVLSADDAVALAAVRGAEMAAACALEPTGMTAVMGGDQEELLATLADLGLTPANRNGAGQTVVAGSLAALDKLSENPPAGTKLVRLKVAGAFHTGYMAPAEEKLRAHAERITVADPNRPLLSNADGAVVTTGSEMLRRLVAQVTLPVRWDACMAALRERGVTATIELPPAGALSGLVKRELRGTATLAVKTPADLDKVADLVAEHATADGGAR
ncbi:ACP S-malonyltransferase [Gandjariella thermophila]|uniref:[acyl-carrier-protein] S-malonyltransferase n=1 Tax=Gandjariella thermophila TaxID=1931992 RepID=A0A4D4J7E2_9PSEU|nr:ACP S-malonyltransferase [Gandjariella thermophila]GDY30436.1 malonyl CoA-acyl carrier protein transacylase [Gandjariella thermophila]